VSDPLRRQRVLEELSINKRLRLGDSVSAGKEKRKKRGSIAVAASSARRTMRGIQTYQPRASHSEAATGVVIRACSSIKIPVRHSRDCNRTRCDAIPRSSIRFVAVSPSMSGSARYALGKPAAAFRRARRFYFGDARIVINVSGTGIFRKIAIRLEQIITVTNQGALAAGALRPELLHGRICNGFCTGRDQIAYFRGR